MIYEALVIDNEDFADKGTIRVRIKQKTLDPRILKDLSVDPKKSIEEYGSQEWRDRNGENVFTYVDTDVKVSSPFGGGFDYGFFYLPQPNSWGLVGNIGDPWDETTRDNYVWLGALYVRDVETHDIHIPSNEIENKYDGVTGTARDTVTHLDNFNSTLVIKTKSTHIAGTAKEIDQNESRNTLDWKKRPTEYLIIIDRDRINIKHNVLKVNDSNEEESVALETIDISDEGFSLNYENKKTFRDSYFKIDNQGQFILTKENEEGETVLDGTEEGIEASYRDGDNSAQISVKRKSPMNGGVNKTEVTLSAYERGKSECFISVKSDGIEISSSGNINISPGENCNVSLGNTGRKVLCSPTDEDVVVGGVTLPASKNVTA